MSSSKAGHPFHLIFTAWLQRKFVWALSNDILAEYKEVLTQRSGRQRWLQFSRVLDLADARGELLIKVLRLNFLEFVASPSSLKALGRPFGIFTYRGQGQCRCLFHYRQQRKWTRGKRL